MSHGGPASPSPWLVTLIAVLWAGCNFDSAFERYCQGNPRCHADAATDPPGRSEASPDLGGGNADSAGQADTELPAPGGDGVPTSPLPESCGSNADCPQGQICALHSHLCVVTCVTADDCPPGNHFCMSAGRRPGLCTCTSDSCDSAAGLFCNPFDGLCEAPCYAPSDCQMFQPPRVCDPSLAFCRPPCISSDFCESANAPRCDTDTGLCGACVDSTDCKHLLDGPSECTMGVCVQVSSTP